MPVFEVRPRQEGDYDWIAALLKERWGSTKIVSRGRIYDADKISGFVAMREGKRAGLTTYNIENEECEIVSLNSTAEGGGIGSALIDAVKEVAASAGCRRLWLITTNDNVKALRFYQKRGFVLVAVHRDALKQARAIKPEIPLVGSHGIPLRDEIELEIPLRD